MANRRAQVREQTDPGKDYRVPRMMRMVILAILIAVIGITVRDSFFGGRPGEIEVEVEEYLDGDPEELVEKLGGSEKEPEVEGYAAYWVCDDGIEVGSVDGERVDFFLNGGRNDVGLFGLSLWQGLEGAEQAAEELGFTVDRHSEGAVYYTRGEEWMLLGYRGEQVDQVAWMRQQTQSGD